MSRPHVSLACLERECCAAQVLGSLDGMDAASLRVDVDSVSLVEVTRGHCSYRWDTLAEIPLAQPAGRGRGHRARTTASPIGPGG